ncbi:hypothetical protein ABT084_31300 [Streptomyces sp. NPDC002138]|uniref:hypothetical protein n=1 Tax=Streptomyces sp. NPDC002138 TaxID=3154410 RepID=UPI00332A671E
MAAVRLTVEGSREFFDRFSGFEDGVITGIRLHLPRPGSGKDHVATFDIQAMDGTRDHAWVLVQIAVGGLYEYQFPCSKQYSYFVLSDGLNLDLTSDRVVLDLDPGPDEWEPDQVGRPGEYSKQYAIGTWCEYEVLDGPFI